MNPRKWRLIDAKDGVGMKQLLGILGFVTVAMVATPASAADQTGPRGQLISLQINARGSDDFSNYHGAARIKVWSKGKPKVHKYMWGGANCPSRDLEHEQIELLSIALTENVNIVPKFKNGQIPNSRCLVSFKLMRSNAESGDDHGDKDRDKGGSKGGSKGGGKKNGSARGRRR
jgi:hypothetical protein